MKAEDEFINELGEIAPKLSSLQKKNIFEVDELYFEELPTLVMNKIHEKQLRRSDLGLTWLFQPKRIAFVMVLAIILIAGSLVFYDKMQTEKPMPLAEVQELLKEPVTSESVIDEVDEGIMIETIAKAPKSIDKKSDKNKAEKKALEQYIINNMDESSLIDDL